MDWPEVLLMERPFSDPPDWLESEPPSRHSGIQRGQPACQGKFGPTCSIPAFNGAPGWPVRVDGKATRVTSCPMLGEHTDQVLSEWLGLTPQAVAEMKREGMI